ncbi:hypothetical protein BDZ97DRAFT_1916042 [Flammula alnicola]|nr:hypothetical protein BDZ97DRAFT_1916042 [Flammula alnicola]
MRTPVELANQADPRKLGLEMLCSTKPCTATDGKELATLDLPTGYPWPSPSLSPPPSSPTPSPSTWPTSTVPPHFSYTCLNLDSAISSIDAHRTGVEPAHRYTSHISTQTHNPSGAEAHPTPNHSPPPIVTPPLDIEPPIQQEADMPSPRPPALSSLLPATSQGKRERWFSSPPTPLPFLPRPIPIPPMPPPECPYVNLPESPANVLPAPLQDLPVQTEPSGPHVACAITASNIRSHFDEWEDTFLAFKFYRRFDSTPNKSIRAAPRPASSRCGDITLIIITWDGRLRFCVLGGGLPVPTSRSRRRLPLLSAVDVHPGAAAAAAAAAAAPSSYWGSQATDSMSVRRKLNEEATPIVQERNAHVTGDSLRESSMAGAAAAQRTNERAGGLVGLSSSSWSWSWSWCYPASTTVAGDSRDKAAIDLKEPMASEGGRYPYPIDSAAADGGWMIRSRGWVEGAAGGLGVREDAGGGIGAVLLSVEGGRDAGFSWAGVAQAAADLKAKAKAGALKMLAYRWI